MEGRRITQSKLYSSFASQPDSLSSAQPSKTEMSCFESLEPRIMSKQLAPAACSEPRLHNAWCAGVTCQAIELSHSHHNQVTPRPLQVELVAALPVQMDAGFRLAAGLPSGDADTIAALAEQAVLVSERSGVLHACCHSQFQSFTTHQQTCCLLHHQQAQSWGQECNIVTLCAPAPCLQ